MTLRHMIINDMEKNPNFDFEVIGIIFGSKEIWQQRMRQDHYFCDDIFIHQAANFLGRDIHLVPMFEQDGHVDGKIVIPSNATEKEPPIYMLMFPETRFYNGHYQSIRPLPQDNNSEMVVPDPQARSLESSPSNHAAGLPYPRDRTSATDAFGEDDKEDPDYVEHPTPAPKRRRKKGNGNLSKKSAKARKNADRR